MRGRCKVSHESRYASCQKLQGCGVRVDSCYTCLLHPRRVLVHGRLARGPSCTRRGPRPSASASALRGGGPSSRHACSCGLVVVSHTESRPAGGRPHVQEEGRMCRSKAIWRTLHHADAETHCASSSTHAHGREGITRPEEGGSYRLATGYHTRGFSSSLVAGRAARSARYDTCTRGRAGWGSETHQCTTHRERPAASLRRRLRQAGTRP